MVSLEQMEVVAAAAVKKHGPSPELMELVRLAFNAQLWADSLSKKIDGKK
jgi:hypothetical protein